MKYKILILNAISEKGLGTFDPERYLISDSLANPDAILVRSADMHGLTLPASLKIIGRAGVGVNNIPVSDCTNAGIPVLNAPGANANAVKELVITGMLLAARHICAAWDYTRQLTGDDAQLHEQVEKNKKKFSGIELQGKTLGVIGLGHIGVKVANAAINLGMHVIGFDQFMTVNNAWQLSAQVEQAQTMAEVCAQADFITLHVPLMESTRHLLNADLLSLMKNSVVIVNFARDEIVDKHDLQDALSSKKVSYYIADFPSTLFQNHPQVIVLPHLGASTQEAEENCAFIVAKNIQQYLENGTLKNAVNFPDVSLPHHPSGKKRHRIAIANRNVPNIIAQITRELSHHQMNIIDMINKSDGDVAYNLIDLDKPPTDQLLEKIRTIDGVVTIRNIT